jgi:capsular exopolysaccharide synthesis family protein
MPDREFIDEEEVGQQGLDLRLLFESLRRRWRPIAAVTVPALILAMIFPFLQKDIYESTSKVLIQETPKVMEIGPDFMPEEQRTRRPLDALIALVLSDAVLGRAVDQMPKGTDPEPGLIERLRGLLGLTSEPPDLTAQQQRQLRIEALRRSITLSAAGGSSQLMITAVSLTPEGAASLANVVADAVVAHKRARREDASQRAVSWLDTRIFELRGQVERRSEELQELARESGLTPSDLLTPSGLAASDSDADVEGELSDELGAARAQLAALEEQLAVLGGGPLPDAARRQDLLALRDQLEAARVELAAAQLRYTPTHPEVVRLNRIVAQLAAQAGTDAGSGQTARTDEQDQEYRMLLDERVRLEARVRVLKRALAELPPDAGPKSGALGTYQRLDRALAIDRGMLELLMQRRNETMLAAATGHTGAEVLDYAVLPLRPVGPKRMRFLVVGIVGALILGVGCGFLLETFDRRIYDPQEAADLLGVPLLGSIPQTPGAFLPARQEGEVGDSWAAESYKNLRTALLFSTGISDTSSKLGTLVVTSGVAGEGKTTLSANLSESFAQVGWRVLLIDADLRRSRVHRLFEVERGPGLADLLRDELGLDDVIRRPPGMGFDIITSGEMPPNPSELLTNERLDRLRPEVRERYDLIVVDSPVLLSVPDALLLAARGDATLLVNKPGSLEKSAFSRMRADLERARARVLGIVVTQVPTGDRYLYPRYLESPYVQRPQSPWRRMLARRRADR